MSNKKILITGSAGFIGFHLTEYLLQLGHYVVGIDNINDYYSTQLKYDRLAESGILEAGIQWNVPVQSTKYPNYYFVRMNLEEKVQLIDLCENEKFDMIINLAAQAGVRYSIENPDVYVQSNLVGFLNILEVSRHFKVKHLIYASSSSVYGLNTKMPFSVDDNVDFPISLYAATKKSNELMAHAYSHLYNIPTTGLRFFTVYGPWGRPDMAYYLFADAISNGRPIKVFNHGNLKRDFTYIDDIIQGIIKVIERPPSNNKDDLGLTNSDASTKYVPYRILNIGNNKPIELGAFIKQIESSLGKVALKNYVKLQDGDVLATWADIDELTNNYGYNPSINIDVGIPQFIKWFKDYYSV